MGHQTVSDHFIKVIGTMVGHSILQDGLGLSTLCFLYIAFGEQEALQSASLSDVGSDAVDFISKVS